MHRRIAMGNVRTAGCALVLFGSLVLCASSVWGQACTPVVYAFRHAEDWNPTSAPYTALTLTGQAHAALYPTMIRDFQAANNFCPVTKVYATAKKKKNGSDGTTNPFETARPLACDVAGKPLDCQVSVTMEDALTTVTDTDGKKYTLFEYVVGDQVPTNLDYLASMPANALRKALLATANLGQSSAIFWTSQGLHVLGGVIINAHSAVPDKNAKPPVTPPRNAVYIFFFYKSSTPAGDILTFIDTPSDSTRTPDIASSVYVQCFNHVEPTYCPNLKLSANNFIEPDTTTSPATQSYACGYGSQSNLGGTLDGCTNDQCGTILKDRNKDIKGKICNTTIPMLADTVGPSISDKKCTAIFGFCK